MPLIKTTTTQPTNSQFTSQLLSYPNKTLLKEELPMTQISVRFNPMICNSHTINYHLLLFLLVVHIIGSLLLQHCEGRDTITIDNEIRDDNETLVSDGKRFQLGFFTPEGVHNKERFVGIWYYRDPRTIVWVANRNESLSDSFGVFCIADDGNLKVLDRNKTTYFSTGLESSSASNRTVKLWDSGNLVLFDNQSRRVLWQSFDYPTDTFLPGMKMDDKIKLTSWRSANDPRLGNFTFELDEELSNGNTYHTRKITTTYWKSGDPGGFDSSNELPIGVACLLSNVNKKSISYHNFTVIASVPFYINTRLLMNSSGQIQYFTASNDNNLGSLTWSEPHDNCSVYNFCGSFGSCNSQNSPLCICVAGFEPASREKWDTGDFESGCTRQSPICNKEGSDIFHNLTMMKMGKPDSQYDTADSEEACRKECLENCLCQAYLYNGGNDTRRGSDNSRHGCWIWNTDLINLQEGYADYNLSIRVAASKIGGQSKVPQNTETVTVSLKAVIISTTLIFLVLLLGSFSYVVYRRKREAKRKETREGMRGNPLTHLHDSERRVKDLIGTSQLKDDDKEAIDVPFFDMEIILAATNNFSGENKLGQGGFGLVYKGMLPGGQEVAVKRLSIYSGQGLEEFKNEVVLIAKLQHRNLVRLLGYCIKAEEKILLYEYMRNRSLDAFIFDQTLGMLLDWEKRFDIILGIARGLLYLHQDSRLRIVHRDLKTSNILLDEEMNPKISDFGLARIVGGKETEANTNRVVGTYGYMSPEYALDGLFSIKSDVFSFGVVVLEIISGKRNTGFYNSKEALNLLGYAWRLWKEERAMDLMDQTLLESCSRSEVLKCINVGLLCVQEDPSDRPTMTNVVLMLGSENATLRNPNQPAFVARKRLSSTPFSSSSKPEAQSNNELTVSLGEGR